MKLYDFIYSINEDDATATKDEFPIKDVNPSIATTNPLLLPQMAVANALTNLFRGKPADDSASSLQLPRKTDLPKADLPKAEVPKADLPKAEVPKPEAPPPVEPKPSKSKTRSEFEKAFADARRQQGSGSVFMFRGKPYSTNYREEGLPGKTNEEVKPISTAGAGGIAGMQSTVPAAGDSQLSQAASTELAATTEKPQDPNAENQKIVPGQTISESTEWLRKLAGI